jgi:formamidopyrimidine-DNA glycosylase
VHDTGSGTTHDHVVFTMENGTIITYNDPRRFGFMELIAAAHLPSHKLFAGMGVEPLGNNFHAGVLAERAAGRNIDLKALLLDQRNVAGLGNIYVCEALHRAGLSPMRKASCLADRRGRPTARAERLVVVIRQVLDEAITAGGSTLKDFAGADGAMGYFQHRFQVYGRAGEACLKPDCSGHVERIVQAGRSTFFCKLCQRPAN